MVIGTVIKSLLLKNIIDIMGKPWNINENNDYFELISNLISSIITGENAHFLIHKEGILQNDHDNISIVNLESVNQQYSCLQYYTWTPFTQVKYMEKLIKKYGNYKGNEIKKTRKSILTLFYKMTINNGTKKIEVPPKGIPCTCYVGSSVGRMFIVVRFLFLCARDFSVQ